MSEPENFLSRWSRRKLEAEQNEDVRPDETAGPPSPLDEASPPAEALAKPDAKEEREQKEEPEFDPSTLPSLESITAETDIRMFLQKGVPAQLTRAALRRAWAADPAIRDFKEIAENQYDFATGSDLPGFGSLDASAEDIRRMVADIFGDSPQPPAEAEAPTPASAETPAETARSEGSESAPGPAATQDVVGSGTDQASPDKAEIAPGQVIVHRNTVDIAMQQDEPSSKSELLPTRRPHGRALPQ